MPLPDVEQTAATQFSARSGKPLLQGFVSVESVSLRDQADRVRQLRFGVAKLAFANTLLDVMSPRADSPTRCTLTFCIMARNTGLPIFIAVSGCSFHAIGAGVTRAALHRVHRCARHQLQHFLGLFADVLHPAVAGM